MGARLPASLLGKGRCLQGVGKRDGRARDPLPPCKGQRCSGCWAVEGWRGLWLLQELSRGAAAKPSLFLGLTLQSCPRGSSSAGMRRRRRVCAGADPAALLMAPGSPASCVTGPGRVGAGTAGGLWSGSSLQHLGDGASQGTRQLEVSSRRGQRQDASPWPGGAVARADPGHRRLCRTASFARRSLEYFAFLGGWPFPAQAAIG